MTSREALLGRIGRWMAAKDSASGPSTPATSVGEITPFTPRESVARTPRINLLVPSINAAHYFGGIHTAVLLYRALATHYPRSRIVLTDSAPDVEACQRFSDHARAECEDDPDAERVLVPYADRYGRSLAVEPGDVWLATAWWTAFAAQRLASWQQRQYATSDRIAYLVQDFEPGFYAWSSRSALALGTYRPDRDVAIFNTRLLADYFESQGICFARSAGFEPTLNDGLRNALALSRREEKPRERRIVIYGRPSTPRNAFELICEGLRAWGWRDPNCANWEVVAPGELLEDVDLGPLRIRALGKLTIEAYSELLATSAVGVSLMISPHPSYPPLEMAAFGLSSITNRFANKDLSSFSPNVRHPDLLSPEAIADVLAAEVSGWESRAMAPLPRIPESHPFIADSTFLPLAEGIHRLLAQP